MSSQGGSSRKLVVGLLLAIAVSSLVGNAYQALNPQVVTRTATRTLPGTTLTSMVTSLSTVFSTVTETRTEAHTETKYAVMWTTTTSVIKITVTSTVAQTQTSYPPPPNCPYPFDPATCNEGPPAVVVGYLTLSGSCVFLYNGDGSSNGTFALYHLPANYAQYENKFVQVQGYVYYNWPSSQPFPPYQFPASNDICVGTPVWVLQGPTPP